MNQFQGMMIVNVGGGGLEARKKLKWVEMKRLMVFFENMEI